VSWLYWSVISLILRRGREERLPQGAGGLTFTTALSIVPLLAVSFALFTRIPLLRPLGEGLREHLLRGLLPADIARTVLRYLAQFTGNATSMTLAGSSFMLLSALALVLSVEGTLNRIWQASPRPVLRRLRLYVAMLLTGPVIVGASLWATSDLLAASSAWVGTHPPWVQYIPTGVTVVLGAFGFACLFRFVPNAVVRRRDAFVGGLLASIAFEVGKRGFALYLANVPTYQTLYGAFAPLLAFLAWVYYSWLVTLGAALVSATLAGAGRNSEARPSRETGGRRRAPAAAR
jgi:membrane protein